MSVDADLYPGDVINISWFALFIVYAYWFHGIHGFCTIIMINIECMWVMMLSYKFNTGCAMTLSAILKGLEHNLSLKISNFTFFSFLMQWNS